MKDRTPRITSNRDNNFNLIRFIAAVLVLFSHSFVIVTGNARFEPLRISLDTTWGTIAVDIFFITSGFLIAYSFFSRRKLLSFIWARVVRIYPALIVAMIFCTFIVGLNQTNLNISSYLTDSQTYFYFLKNSLLVFGVEHQLPGVFTEVPYMTMVNTSIWTLPYELTMYGCLAIFGTVLTRAGKLISVEHYKYIFLIIAVIGISTHIFNHFNNFMPVNLLRLFAMFFVGSAIYIHREIVIFSHKWLFVLSVLMAISTLHKDVFFVIYSLTIPYFVFYFAYVPKGKILSFNKVGDYSYGIYIFGFPIQQLLISNFPNLSISSLFVYSLVATLSLGILSWHLIEKRALKLKIK